MCVTNNLDKLKPQACANFNTACAIIQLKKEAQSLFYAIR